MKNESKCVSDIPDIPVAIYDGECDFCIWCVNHAQNHLTGDIEFVPFQTLDDRFEVIKADDLRRAVHFVETSGQFFQGAEAVARLASYTSKYRVLHSLHRRVPLYPFFASIIYRFVADNRWLAMRIVRLLGG